MSIAESGANDVTHLLVAWGKGDETAVPSLVPLVYAELRRMEKCYQERTNGMAWLAVAPEFDPLRADPRFDMYLRRTGLK